MTRRATAARDFRRARGCDGVLITRGEHGMWLSSDGRAKARFPRSAREVADVTGAGDTVVATLALALAAGATLAEAAVARQPRRRHRGRASSARPR